jgi:hypothetical protein
LKRFLKFAGLLVGLLSTPPLIVRRLHLAAKQLAELKNAGPFRKERLGREKRAGWGFLGTGNVGFAATLVVFPAPQPWRYSVDSQSQFQ